LAALLALLSPDLAREAPAIVAIVRGEGSGSNGS
jgi:hypothetical protein